MRKISIALSKGGVSKSTTSVAVAHGLANQGKKVLLVDTDDQGQVAFLLGLKAEKGLADVLNGDCSPQEAMIEARPNLWLLAGGRALSSVKRSIGKKEFGGEHTLAEALAPLEGSFDYIILDTSPAWDSLTINTLFYADEVLSPISLEILTLNSLQEFSSRLDSVQRYNEKISHAYILPTFADRRVKKSGEVLEMLKKHFGGKVCDPIRYSVRVSEAAGFGQSIYEFDKKSPAAIDYQKLVSRILEDEQRQKSNA